MATPVIDPGSWISDVTLYLAQSSHPVAVITVMTNLQRAFPSQSWRTPAGALWEENTPVHFRYRWYTDDPGDFYGYVASSRVLATESDPRYAGLTLVPVQYTCVGASMPMQSHANRLWQDNSCSYMARTVSQENCLLPWVEISDEHFSQRMQSGSDWQFLVDLADRCSYRLNLDGTTMHFVRESTYLPTSDGSLPQFWMRKIPGLIDGLRAFSGVTGETDPAGGVRSRLTTTALNTQSQKLSTATFTSARTDRLGRPVRAALDQQYSQLPVADYSEGERLLSSASTFLWVQAQAVTNGDTRLKPGALVDLRGDGISESHQGTWMVREATHTLTIDHFSASRTDYTTTLLLGRNGADALDLPAQSIAPPGSYGSNLVNGRWRAVSVGAI
ncbi:hypothetical protein BGM09_01160 [Streptomyces sp. CBMA29]|nr:hypothetical protein [Streptomyces sp. CBMA29]